MKGGGAGMRTCVCVTVHMHQIFHFCKDVNIFYLVKNYFLYTKSHSPSFSILEKSLANSRPEACEAGACWTKPDCGIFSAICLC